MTTLENVKQWFIDRDLENGGRLDKQALKLSEEFGELCAGWQALGMDALLSFIWPVLSSKKESEEDYSCAVKSSISKIITCAFLIWLASLFI